MSEKLLALFAPLLNLNPIVYTIVISLVPMIELRGAIPAAIAMGLEPWSAFWWSVVGSMIPAPFIILLFDWALKFLTKRGWCRWLTSWLDRLFADKVEKVCSQQGEIECSDKKTWQKEWLKFWAIAVFVAVPLPGTGVYTGSGIASLIKMPFWKALLAVLLGDVIAGLIVLALSVGALAVF